MSKTRKKTLRKGTVMGLRLADEEIAELDTIAGWMRKDPKIRRLKANIGRPAAIRYAIGRLIANPPEHVEAQGG